MQIPKGLRHTSPGLSRTAGSYAGCSGQVSPSNSKRIPTGFRPSASPPWVRRERSSSQLEKNPKGFCPPAQGWPAPLSCGPTLGTRPKISSNPERVVPSPTKSKSASFCPISVPLWLDCSPHALSRVSRRPSAARFLPSGTQLVADSGSQIRGKNSVLRG
jgi:hypothetical protein